MRISKLSMLVAAGAMCFAQPATLRSELLLSKDEIDIYNAFLKSYAKEAPQHLNLGNRTIMLSDLSREDGCLEGAVMQDLQRAPSTTRPLIPAVIKGSKASLVDPMRQSARVRINDPGDKLLSGTPIEDLVTSAFATGLLQLSEIAFDKSHRYAVLQFSFSLRRALWTWPHAGV